MAPIRAPSITSQGLWAFIVILLMAIQTASTKQSMETMKLVVRYVIDTHTEKARAEWPLGIPP